MARKNYIVGSGNLLEDVGHRVQRRRSRRPNSPEDCQRSSQAGTLASGRSRCAEDDQLKMSALVRGSLAGFSLAPWFNQFQRRVIAPWVRYWRY